jgi:dolichyldiphosphatase
MDFDSADIAEQIALKAVSLTHVRYAKGDQLGHALSWASLLPVFIGLGGFMSHFIFRRELQAMFFGLGLCVSEVINQVRWFVDSCHLPFSPSIGSCAAVLF